MPKPKNHRRTLESQQPAITSKPTVTPKITGPTRIKNAVSESKQVRIISMLRSPTGATIAAVMDATGWQPHSVRGFLAGVVRKRLKLKLESEQSNGNRIYRIIDAGLTKAGAKQLNRRVH